ncbi:MAG: YebC/PmpR family DNA-binding transcriptional regulator [Planctomycetota bacterium]|nr:YebC/PmpR family DNA-binding transcriptional regulator [Planctomycetota bacterium]
MAGHSKFKNIMHRKKAVDAKRSNAFNKHAKLIMSAARTGGADVSTNLTLRHAIERARSDNMTKDAIARAIAKGAGGGDEKALETITYEGYGPGGVAMLIEALTDNRNRTVSEVRNVMDKNGGRLGDSGSVAWNFERKAVFFVAGPAEKEEEVLLVAMEAEADDCESIEGGFEITADPTRFGIVADALEAGGFSAERSDIASLAKTTVTLEDPDQIRKVVNLMGLLEALEDVQSTASNLDWTDAALAIVAEG